MFSEIQFDRVPVDQNSVVSLDIFSLIAFSIKECISRLVEISRDKSIGAFYYGVTDRMSESIEPLLYFNIITTCKDCGSVVEVKPDVSEQIFKASVELIICKELFNKERLKCLPTKRSIRAYIRDNFLFDCNTDCPECESTIYLWSEDDKIVGDSSFPIIINRKKHLYPG